MCYGNLRNYEELWKWFLMKFVSIIIVIEKFCVMKIQEIMKNHENDFWWNENYEFMKMKEWYQETLIIQLFENYFQKQ